MTKEKEQTRKQLQAELSKLKLKRPTKKQIQIEITIRNKIRFDKLCPACSGPLEIDRTNKCWKCDVQMATRAQLDFIEGGAMSIGYDLGIKRPPKPHRQPEPTTKQKTTKRKKQNPKGVTK